MRRDLLTVGVGIVLILWARWYMPREFGRIRNGLDRRGRSPERFDTLLRSRRYHLLVVVMGLAGMLAVVAGSLLLVLGE